LKQQSAQCRLSQLVELVPLEKEGREYGMSNPVRVLECLTAFMEECKEGKITWKSLIRKLHAETGCQVSEEEIHDLLLQSEMPGSDSQMDSGYIEDVDSLKKVHYAGKSLTMTISMSQVVQKQRNSLKMPF
jgi:hypothetical protein